MNEEEDITGGGTDEQIYQAYQTSSIGLILMNNVGQYYIAYFLKLFEYMDYVT